VYLKNPLMSNMRSCMDHVYNIIICYVIHDHQMFSNYQPLRPKNLPWYRSTFKNYLMDWVHDPAIFQPQHLSFGCARCLSAVKWSRQSHRPTVLPKSMVKLLNFHKNQLDIYSHNSCKIWVAHSSSGGSQALPQSVSECGPCPPSRKPQPGKIKKMHSNACSCSIKMRLDHVLYILVLLIYQMLPAQTWLCPSFCPGVFYQNWTSFAIGPKSLGVLLDLYSSKGSPNLQSYQFPCSTSWIQRIIIDSLFRICAHMNL
jgi:hypothetical protein